MKIVYQVNEAVSALQFQQLLIDSTLGERRPVDDYGCLRGMMENSNLIVTAWHKNTLVGMARSVTDFHYCCYLSDLAVHKDYQRQGIGKQLQNLTQEQLGQQCKLILIAAPDAADYYQHIGFEPNERCFVLERNSTIK